jgi:hypothetical protein
MDGYSIRIPKLPVPKHWYSYKTGTKTKPTSTSTSNEHQKTAEGKTGTPLYKMGAKESDGGGDKPSARKLLDSSDMDHMDHMDHMSGFDGDLSPTGKQALNVCISSLICVSVAYDCNMSVFALLFHRNSFMKSRI